MSIDYDPLAFKASKLKQKESDARLRQAQRDEDDEPRRVYEARLKEIDDEYNRKISEIDKRDQMRSADMLRSNLQGQLQDIDKEISSTKGWKYGQEPESQKYVGDLERKKAGILNAMLGKGIDIGDAFPKEKEKESYRTTQDPFGGIVQVDKSGKIVTKIPRPTTKEPEKAKPNYLEAAQIKAASELIKKAYEDPETADPAMLEKAQRFLGQMQMKYGKGLSMETPEENEETIDEPPEEKKARTVIRTGIDKKTGKRAIKYDDGSLEYAS